MEESDGMIIIDCEHKLKQVHNGYLCIKCGELLTKWEEIARWR